jgi:hypothetical protein
MARDLGDTEGMAGQAISISGLFALITSLLVATAASRYDRRHVLVALTAATAASLTLVAAALSFAILMAARALFGVTIGGFRSLSTATVMRLVPEESIPRAMGVAASKYPGTRKGSSPAPLCSIARRQSCAFTRRKLSVLCWRACACLTSNRPWLMSTRTSSARRVPVHP